MAARRCPGSSVLDRMAHEGATPDGQFVTKLVAVGMAAGEVPEYSRMAGRADRASTSAGGNPRVDVSRFISRSRQAKSATGTLRGAGIFSTNSPREAASAMTRSSAGCVTSRSRSFENTVSPRCRA